MSKAKFLALLNLFGVVKDSSGNISAQINVRKDTLANLLAITSAGDGEIGMASDTDALVLYRHDGANSRGMALFSPAEANIYMACSGNNITNGSAIPITTLYCSDPTWSYATPEFSPPAHFGKFPWNQSSAQIITSGRMTDCNVVGSRPPDAGTTVTFTLQRYSFGAWASVTGCIFTAVENGGVFEWNGDQGNFAESQAGITIEFIEKYRWLVNHDSTTTADPHLNFDCFLKFQKMHSTDYLA